VPTLQLDTLAFDLPAGWSTAAVIVHSTEAPAAGGPAFAPTVIVSKRLELDESDDLDEVLANDLEDLEAQHAGFVLEEQSQVRLRKAEGRAVEYQFTDAQGLRLRQRLVLAKFGGVHVALTATATAASDFTPVRRALDTVTESLVSRP
jgi:hypothetical protein